METVRLKKKVDPPPAPQRTIILQCLAEAYPAGMSLDNLASECEKRDYRRTFKTETDVLRSILYHLNRMDEVEWTSKLGS
jgi:repressor of nif and glnA expression